MRAAVLAGALLAGSVALAQDVPAPDCGSIESFYATHGVAYEVTIAHVVLPLSAQSQSCPIGARMSSAEFRTALGGLVRALGCGHGTGAYDETEALLAEQVPDGTIEGRGTGDIPARYLSTDPAFCEAKPLAGLRACADPESPCGPFAELEDD